MKKMYEGNHLFCSSCRFKPEHIVNKGRDEYTSCKAIDHRNIKLYPKIYGGYSESIRLCEICGHYEPETWIKKSSFKNIAEYIEFMDLEWYQTSKHYENKGINKIRHCRHISLIIGNIWLEVPLYDWMNNSWNTSKGIKYIRKYKISRKSNGSMKSKIRIDNLKLGGFGFHE